MYYYNLKKAKAKDILSMRVGLVARGMERERDDIKGGEI